MKILLSVTRTFFTIAVASSSGRRYKPGPTMLNGTILSFAAAQISRRI